MNPLENGEACIDILNELVEFVVELLDEAEIVETNQTLTITLYKYDQQELIEKLNSQLKIKKSTKKNIG